MAVTVTYGSIIMFLSVLPSFIASVFSFYSYKKNPYPHFLYLGITMILMSTGGLLIAYSYVTLDLLVYRLGVMLSAPTVFGVYLLIDSISKAANKNYLLVFVTAVCSAMIITGLSEEGADIHTTFLGEKAPIIVGNFNIASSIGFVTGGTLWLYYMTKIHLNAPRQVKRYSMVNLTGAIIAGPGSAIVFSTGLVWILPGLDYFLISVGYLICTYAFVREPKLGYVLPFDVHVLQVYHFDRGTPLFTHHFSDSVKVNDMLLSGILKSISSVLDEALQRGEINAILLKNDTLLVEIREDEKIAFALLVSDSNDLLKYGLNLFASNFITKYYPNIKKMSSDLTPLYDAHQLVEEVFPFVVQKTE